MSNVLTKTKNLWEEIIDSYKNLFSHTKEKIVTEKDNIKSAKDVVDYISTHIKAEMSDDEKEKIKNEAAEAYVLNLNASEEKIKKEKEKINDLILDRACKQVNGYSMNDIDKDLKNKIMKLRSMSEQFDYIQRARYSNKLVNYAIWVSTDENAIGITNFDKETKEFINGICKLLHADQQYKNVGYADVELYDPWISGWQNQRFLINYEKIRNLSSINFQDRINRKNNPFVPSPIGSNPVFKEGLISPIHFASPNEHNTLIDPSTEVEDSVKYKLDSALLPYINGRSYWYEKDIYPNTYKLIIKNPQNGYPEEYRLVLGYHGLNTVSLVVKNFLGMTIAINQSTPELWERVLSNAFYQISDVDTNLAAQYQSEFFWIYNLIDMSCIPEDEIRVNRLDAKLNIIFGQLQQRGIQLAERYRFDVYNSINDFTLISDEHVVPCFSNTVNTDGSIIIVENNEACYRLNNRFESVTC